MKDRRYSGKASWTYETDLIDYDVLLHYHAWPEVGQTWNSPAEPSTCEVYGVEVTEVREYGPDPKNELIRKRKPTSAEQVAIAAAILDRYDKDDGFSRLLHELAFDDANERSER